MDLKEFFLEQKQATHRGTLDVLGKIPPEKLAWRPAEGMLTLGEIARHIWASEDGIRKIALEDNWNYFKVRIPKGLGAVLGEVTSLDEELRQVKRAHETTLVEVAAFPLERWDEERVNEEFKIRRRVHVFLFGITEHQIHHRAQIGAYLHILTGERASAYAL